MIEFISESSAEDTTWRLQNFKQVTQYLSPPNSLATALQFKASLLINNVLITESKGTDVTMQVMIEHETRQYTPSAV